MLFAPLLAAALAGCAHAANHLVGVSAANGSLIFNPSNTVAAMGDTVTFSFWPKNHSVAQAAFANPCEPMANGFWSGYMPVTTGTGQMQFQLTVNATTPVWFYCSQAMHCQSGMVGSINAPATGNTIEKFMSTAMSAKTNVAPAVKAGTGGKIIAAAASSNGGNSTNGGAGGKGGATPSPSPSSSNPAQATTGAGSMLEARAGLVYSGMFAALGLALL